ncbi:hypothetical protein ACJMK2_015743 [Sinanodonta woodiana]|uniref:Tumor suppressor candidate 2 n=1 Tax=Sinanodonta woodiana TaxID=1069815 RepID=A0ABD3URC5_SINWO
MGQSFSCAARKITRSVSSIFMGQVEECGNIDKMGQMEVTPFVFKRTGSMYFDEDGDLAHEFYEEVVDESGRTMRRKLKNLKPQGDVALTIPRLNVDFPVVMCEFPYSR